MRQLALNLFGAVPFLGHDPCPFRNASVPNSLTFDMDSLQGARSVYHGYFPKLTLLIMVNIDHKKSKIVGRIFKSCSNRNTMVFTDIAEEGNRRIEMKRPLNLVIITVLAATVAGTTQANPHYTDFSGFVVDTQQGGWSLIQEDFTNLQTTGPFNSVINDFDINSSSSLAYGDEIGDLRAILEPNDFIKFAFDQEIAAFGFDYGGVLIAPISETIAMKVFDSSGAEISFLSQMVPPSSNAIGNTDFYGIVDKNSPLQFQAITFVNTGSQTGSWGIDNLYFARIVPLPASAWMALPLLGVMIVIGKMRRRRCA